MHEASNLSVLGIHQTDAALVMAQYQHAVSAVYATVCCYILLYVDVAKGQLAAVQTLHLAVSEHQPDTVCCKRNILYARPYNTVVEGYVPHRSLLAVIHHQADLRSNQHLVGRLMPPEGGNLHSEDILILLSWQEPEIIGHGEEIILRRPLGNHEGLTCITTYPVHASFRGSPYISLPVDGEFGHEVV